MFLEVKGLKKKYGQKEALKSISFSAEEGEIVCILGPSGCGKTTILQSLGGFISIDGGEIILNDKDITKTEAEERPFATVFQSYGLFPHKSVIENIIYGLKFKKYKKKDSLGEGLKMLEILNLKGYENRKVTELSGGEQQRVALGRSLIVKPKLLLLDEPFSNLDTNLKIFMREELLRIRDVFSVTILFVTHDQEDAFSIADRLILMNEGNIEQIDTARNLYLYPKTKFALNFIGSSVIEDDNSFVRPECVRLNDENSGEEGEVINKVFKGSFIEYIVKVKRSEYIMVKLSSEKELEIGDRVYVDIERRKI